MAIPKKVQLNNDHINYNHRALDENGQPHFHYNPEVPKRIWRILQEEKIYTNPRYTVGFNPNIKPDQSIRLKALLDSGKDISEFTDEEELLFTLGLLVIDNGSFGKGYKADTTVESVDWHILTKWRHAEELYINKPNIWNSWYKKGIIPFDVVERVVKSYEI